MIRKNMKNLLWVAMLSVSATAFAATDNTAVKVKWGYTGNTGPANWGQLNPDFAACSDGQMQSPINIPNSVKNLPYLLNVNYTSAPMMIVENGQATLTLGQTQTIYNEGHGVQLNFPNTKETLNFNGTAYELTQLHIHTPSENRLQGQSFPLEIHFVHQGPNGKAAAIGVFVKEGAANPALQQVIDHLPPVQGQVVTVKGQYINPMQLLPARHNYYTFMGSLTTPPCTEGLLWLVMVNPITASAAQISALQAAIGEPNARPLQPLNNRTITAAAEKI